MISRVQPIRTQCPMLADLLEAIGVPAAALSGSTASGARGRARQHSLAAARWVAHQTAWCGESAEALLPAGGRGRADGCWPRMPDRHPARPMGTALSGDDPAAAGGPSGRRRSAGDVPAAAQTPCACSSRVWPAWPPAISVLPALEVLDTAERDGLALAARRHHRLLQRGVRAPMRPRTRRGDRRQPVRPHPAARDRADPVQRRPPVASLAIHPATTTTFRGEPEQRALAGMDRPGILRRVWPDHGLSVGRPRHHRAQAGRTPAGRERAAAQAGAGGRPAGRLGAGLPRRGRIRVDHALEELLRLPRGGYELDLERSAETYHPDDREIGARAIDGRGPWRERRLPGRGHGVGPATAIGSGCSISAASPIVTRRGGRCGWSAPRSISTSASRPSCTCAIASSGCRLALEAGGLGVWEYDLAADRVRYDAICCARLGWDLESHEHSRWREAVRADPSPRSGQGARPVRALPPR